MRRWLSPLMVLALLGVACNRPPRRPASVPAQAEWVGEKKPGHFILVESRTELGWIIKVYDAKSGALVTQGEYRVAGMARAEILPGEMARFDGQAIHLRDGDKLVPKR